jgi:hypothetical protein
MCDAVSWRIVPGRTEFGGVPTKSCLAMGPDEYERIDAITGHLKLLFAAEQPWMG